LKVNYRPAQWFALLHIVERVVQVGSRRTLLNRGIAPARAAGIRSASGSLFTGLGADPRPQRSGRRGRGDLAVDQRTVYRLSSVA
jgi:hypothetical protein